MNVFSIPAQDSTPSDSLPSSTSFPSDPNFSLHCCKYASEEYWVLASAASCARLECAVNALRSDGTRPDFGRC